MDLQWILKNKDHGARSTAITLLTGLKNLHWAVSKMMAVTLNSEGSQS